jgi:hypothetical protein
MNNKYYFLQPVQFLEFKLNVPLNNNNFEHLKMSRLSGLYIAKSILKFSARAKKSGNQRTNSEFITNSWFWRQYTSSLIHVSEVLFVLAGY